MRIKKNLEFSVSRSDFDSRCKPGVSSSWMESDFCFAIENSRSFKTVIQVCNTNSSSHCLSRDAEHIRLTAFRWRCDEVEMRGTCLEAEKSMQTKVVINSWKLYYDTEDTFTRNQLWHFPIFEGMKKFYYRHSVKKYTKYPFDSRAHLKTVRRLWFPTSDRLETWLMLSRTIRSKQYHKSTMVWRNLPSYHLWQCLLPLCHALLGEKDKTKYQERSYGGRLRQTMVDSWNCPDRVVPEGMSQVWRRSEVGNHKRRTLNTRLSFGTSEHTSWSSRNVPGRMIGSDLFWSLTVLE